MYKEIVEGLAKDTVKGRGCTGSPDRDEAELIEKWKTKYVKKAKCPKCGGTKLRYKCTGPSSCGAIHRKDELVGPSLNTCPSCGNPQMTIENCPLCT